MAHWFSLVLMILMPFQYSVQHPEALSGGQVKEISEILGGCFSARSCGSCGPWRWSLEALEIRSSSQKEEKKKKREKTHGGITCSHRSHCGSRCHMHVTWHGRTLAVAEMTLIVAARGSSCCRALSPVSNIGCPSRSVVRFLYPSPYPCSPICV